MVGKWVLSWKHLDANKIEWLIGLFLVEGPQVLILSSPNPEGSPESVVNLFIPQLPMERSRVQKWRAWWLEDELGGSITNYTGAGKELNRCGSLLTGVLATGK